MHHSHVPPPADVTTAARPVHRETAGGKQSALDAIVRQGFVPIFVNDSLDSQHLVEASVAAGCRAVEYSCRRPDSRRMIPWIKREFPSVVVLAATLMDGPRVEAFLRKTRDGFLGVDEAVDLGADGLVSFMRFRPETYVKYGGRCVMIPGVATQNEALDQMELGADLIKTTVSSAQGVDLVTKSQAVTHQCIPYFISGGVNPANIEGYLKSGVAVAAAGFDVILGGAKPGEGELVGVARDSIARMVGLVASAREQHQPVLATAIRHNAANLLAAGRWFNNGP